MDNTSAIPKEGYTVAIIWLKDIVILWRLKIEYKTLDESKPSYTCMHVNYRPNTQLHAFNLLYTYCLVRSLMYSNN